LNLSNR